MLRVLRVPTTPPPAREREREREVARERGPVWRRLWEGRVELSTVTGGRHFSPPVTMALKAAEGMWRAGFASKVLTADDEVARRFGSLCPLCSAGGRYAKSKNSWKRCLWCGQGPLRAGSGACCLVVVGGGGGDVMGWEGGWEWGRVGTKDRPQLAGGNASTIAPLAPCAIRRATRTDSVTAIRCAYGRPPGFAAQHERRQRLVWFAWWQGEWEAACRERLASDARPEQQQPQSR